MREQQESREIEEEEEVSLRLRTRSDLCGYKGHVHLYNGIQVRVRILYLYTGVYLNLELMGENFHVNIFYENAAHK